MEWLLDANGHLIFKDAADNGFFSLQVEGLLVRYLASQPPLINTFGAKASQSGVYTYTFDRYSWDGSLVTNGQWEQLRSDLYQQFSDGIYSWDLQFSDLAIDWLKSGKPCVAGVCSKLPESNPDLKTYKFD